MISNSKKKDQVGIEKYIEALRVNKQLQAEIIEYKQTVDKLRESEEKYRALFQTAKDAIFLSDETGAFTDVNQAACESLGYTKEELLALSPKDIDADISGWEAFQKVRERLVKQITFEVNQRKKDGTLLPVEITGNFFNINGKKTILAIARDITERKQAEEAVNRHTRELEQSNSMKDLCIDIIRHDLLNPLSVVNGYVEILQKSETSTQTKAHLKKIKRNLNKALKLIEDVTIFAQLESLEMIEFDDQDLKAVIERVVETFQPIASMSGMKIDNNITQNMPIKAHTIIDEVFANILSNAVKYAKNGKRIRVEGEHGREFWRVKIIDFGEGINNADKTRIFERFMRNDNNGVKGSGMGLAIVKKIMELHNGRVWVEDNPKGGAIFVVEIPKS